MSRGDMHQTWMWFDKSSRRRQETTDMAVVLALPHDTSLTKVYHHPTLGRVCIIGDALYIVKHGELIHCRCDV